ncbi:MAG: XRE family transcriptional regulator [Erysipelotrichaceae bacterium]|nr:XRE family transcriptional regulator [Erysipelotrichaceae bacterium]
MTIGERIKQRRQQLNMSQAQLALKLNYRSRSSINKIELNHNDITQSKVIAFAQALKTTPAYLMGWEEHDYPPVSYQRDISSFDFNHSNMQVSETSDIIRLPEHLFNAKSDYFYYYLSDDAMINDNLYQNDLVIIEKTNTINNGDTALFMNEEIILCRKYFVDEVTGIISLIAANAKITPITITAKKDIVILGKLCFVLSKR